MSTVYQGLCKGGPLDGKVQAKQDRRFTVDAGKDDGFYVYSNARGSEPAQWLWINRAKKDKSA